MMDADNHELPDIFGHLNQPPPTYSMCLVTEYGIIKLPMKQLDLFNQDPVTEAYFNTVSVKGEDLKERHKKVGKQNADILAVMQELKSATPSQVHSRMNTKAPLTSFRRAINTLTADGYLVKTEEKVMGPFGHPEHVWKLKE